MSITKRTTQENYPRDPMTDGWVSEITTTIKLTEGHATMLRAIVDQFHRDYPNVGGTLKEVVEEILRDDGKPVKVMHSGFEEAVEHAFSKHFVQVGSTRGLLHIKDGQIRKYFIEKLQWSPEDLQNFTPKELSALYNTLTKNGKDRSSNVAPKEPMVSKYFHK